MTDIRQEHGRQKYGNKSKTVLAKNRSKSPKTPGTQEKARKTTDRENHRLLYRKKGRFTGTTWNSSVLGRQSQREKDRSMKWHKIHKERITKQNWKYKPETLIYNNKQRSINYKFRVIT